MVKKRRWKVIYRYVCRSSKNPESVARGVGLGLFIGFLPAIGLQVILALVAANLFKANRLVAVLGTLITNPFTTIPISAFSLWLGDWILPGTNLSGITMKNFQWSQLFASSTQLGISFLTGCLVLSIISGLLGYGVTKAYFAKRSCGPRF